MLFVATFALSLPISATGQVDSGCRRRLVTVNVMDEQRRLVTNLQKEDFQAELRGHPVEIRSVTPAAGPRSVLLLVDSSGSMQGSGFSGSAWEPALLLAAQIIKTIRLADRVQVAFFADSVKGRVDFPPGDREDVEERLRRVAGSPKGRTAILDSMRAVLRSDAAAPTPISEIILLTDNDGDNLSKAGLQELRKTLGSRDVRLFLLLVQSGGSIGRSEVNLLDLARLAEYTGGYTMLSKFFGGPRKAEASREAAQSLTTWWLTANTLELELPMLLEKPTGWKLRVVDGMGRERKKLDVLYPRELFPCEAAVRVSQ